ncbi:hypothetical protein [Haladaptatus sp. NG-SE-30]
MAGPLMGKKRNRNRLAGEMEELQRKIEQHERELALMKQLERESRTIPIGSGECLGVCAECGQGILLCTADRLHCTSCAYQQYL